jgi:hypothetical protein
MGAKASGVTAKDLSQACNTVERFLQAVQKDDEATAKAQLILREGESLDIKSMRETTLDYELGKPEVDGDQIIIEAKVRESDQAEPTSRPLVLSRVEGTWKIDIGATVNRMLGVNLDETMTQMAEGLGEVMEGVGKAMAEGLSQAFGEESPAKEPQSWDDVSLTPTAEELLPVPEMIDLPKTQSALSEAVGSPVLMRVAMSDLLRQVGDDKPDVLFNWFEDQLFAGWAGILEQVGQTMPLKDRLRAVRIEGASRDEVRFLAVDGSDLVYRMLLPFDEGFYQYDQALALLPGVLAGLPEAIDPSVAGHRLLPIGEESVTLDPYRRHVAPRYMRRISNLIGHHVELDANWDELGERTDSGRTLAIWGLNRIHGGIAFACLDPSRREELSKGLACIRICPAPFEPKCYARYEDPVLEFGLRCNGGADSGCYEHEIAQALPEGPPQRKAKRPRKREK